MLIEGSINSEKTAILIDSFVDLIKQEKSTSNMLFICLNSFKKEQIIKTTTQKLVDLNINGISALPVKTFNGVVYNSILNNWSLVEELFPNDSNRSVLPALSGLDCTQYLLKQSINKVNFSDYFSKNNLMHQLFKRYRLITENGLSDKEIEERSKLANESFSQEAKLALNHLKKIGSNLRSFDFIKQTNLFLYLLKQNKLQDFNDIEYVFVDDMDELSYAAFSFIENLLPNTKDVFLAADPQGGSRRGYLCAYPQGWEKIKLKYKDQDIKKIASKSKLSDDAELLFKNLNFAEENKLSNFNLSSCTKRAGMVEIAASRIKSLLCNEANPQDITIITPCLDENLKYSLLSFFDSENISYQFLSGSKNLLDNKYVYGSIIIAQLINPQWNLTPSAFEIRILLNNLLNIPVSQCEQIINSYKKSKKISDKVDLEVEEFDKKYKGLIKTISELHEDNSDLDIQLVKIFSRLIQSEITEDTSLKELNEVINSLNSFIQLISKLPDKDKPQFPEKEWILQLKNAVTSDNPPSAPDIKPKSVLISTPQKIIDFEISTKYQIWLDVSDQAWVKEDTGPLYNAWVFQKEWTQGEYTLEIHKKLTTQKTAHLTRKLAMCANEKIFCYMSHLNSSGNENTGFLPESIDPSMRKKTGDFLNITPREDQKPVLEYTKGKMAVPAVPGAGKTTIMQALIIELLKKNIQPSRIMVVTYMESAARNFLEKIKKSCPGLNELPHISTIHSLAYKIIMEEGNHVKLGLDSGFSICDDTERPRIIRALSNKHLPFGEDPENWKDIVTTGISKSKINDVSPNEIQKNIQKYPDSQLEDFLPVYKDYVITLKQRNMVDYDDLLVMAIKLLKEHSSIRTYYQDLYSYVIEDEAQDSSPIQQEFISILSEKHGNLIRCGDVNQAITTTFSDADVKGFKTFIENNHKVEMQSSQRSAKGVYELANHLVDWSKTQEFAKNTFYDIKMQPVAGGNPKVTNSLNFHLFKTPHEEKDFILKELRNKLKENKNQTFGLLLRANWQVFAWADFLEQNGIKIICRTDTLKQKKVFRFILKLLEVLNTPWNNKQVADLYEEFTKIKKFEADSDLTNFIRTKLGTPFVSYKINSNDLPVLEGQNSCNFWWELHYWLEHSHIPAEELVIKIGNYYFNNVLDRSNAQLLSILIKKFSASFNDDNSILSIKLPEIVKHFSRLQNENKISGVKFFNEEDESKDNALNGFVQVMTLHKSKGDEFDTVFIPEMYENSYALSPENIRLRPENTLINKIIALSPNKKSLKSKKEIISEQIEETLRLIYVGVTRAKKYLYLSSAKSKLRKDGGAYNAKPSKLLEHLIENYTSKTEVAVNE